MLNYVKKIKGATHKMVQKTLRVNKNVRFRFYQTKMPGVIGGMIERPKMTRSMYQALKRHILAEREKKKQGKIPTVFALNKH